MYVPILPQTGLLRVDLGEFGRHVVVGHLGHLDVQVSSGVLKCQLPFGPCSLYVDDSSYHDALVKTSLPCPL